MSEPVEVAGIKYAIGRMDPRKSFHVARRLAPVMTAIATSLKAGANISAPDGKIDMQSMLDALGPMSEAFASMKDEDANYVIDACLSVCSRANEVHGTGWSPVVAANGRLMFQDIDMPQMLQLAWAAISENLGSFFSGLPSTSGAGDQPAA